MMPLRLNELLERIRPAGTAGAPSEGDGQREEPDRAGEIADIARVLAGFEIQADTIVAAAAEEARHLTDDGRTKAAAISDGIPRRIAADQAETVRTQEETTLEKQTFITAEAKQEVARLRTQAAELGPSVRDAAVAEIWSVLLDPLGSEERS